MALVIILPIGALMAAVLRNNVASGVANTSNNIQSTVVDDSDEWSYLAHKYIDRIVLGDNNTVRLNTNTNLRNASVIDPSDMQELEEYQRALDAIASCVEDGTMYIDDDGNYYVTGSSNSLTSRGLNGGRDQFYIRTEKIWFVWVPVGYYLALNTVNSIALGIATWIFSISASIISNVQTKVDEFRKSLGATLFDMMMRQFFGKDGNFVADFVSIVLQMKAIADSIDFVFVAFSGGISAIISAAIRVLVSLLASYIHDRVGFEFLQRSCYNLSDGNNTVVMESDLILNWRKFGRYVY
jgi:hypothetical protein